MVKGNPISPYYQCIAASKTNDPVAGGWWLYPVRMDPGTAGAPPVGIFNDYVKVGLWHDCLYLSANEFDSTGNYTGVAFGSLSRDDLYSGAPLTYSLGYLPSGVNFFPFTLIPSNNQGTGANAAQPGTPNYYVSESGTQFSFEVRTFTAGPNCGAGGVLSALTNVSQTAYTRVSGGFVPQPNTSNLLDVIDDRLMQKVQYRKIGSSESLWITHPVGTASGRAAMQWAQLDVTGGTIATSPVQQGIHAPDTTLYRWMGSLAVDSQGDMALGYSTSNGTAPNFPSIAYAGRLVTDSLNALPQTEVQMFAGSGSQTNTCGPGACIRWGDYSGMSLDPADSCTFWYVNEYYASQVNGTNGDWQTRIGAFKFPSCTASPRPTTATTTLVSSLNPAGVGASVTFTATVTGSTPTGTVDFTDGGSSIASCSAVPLSGGGSSPTASCTTNALAAGMHTIIADYAGDANNTASVSNALSQAIGSINVALAANGGVASASSTYNSTPGYTFPVASVNDGDRTGKTFGHGGGWASATANVFPDWVQITFNGQKTIDQVIVYTLQDNFANGVDPPNNMTFTLYGVTAFQVQGWNGAAWVSLGAAVANNNLVKVPVNFAAFTTNMIRVNVTAGLANYARIVEIEAWTPSGGPAPTTTTLISSLNPSTVGTKRDLHRHGEWQRPDRHGELHRWRKLDRQLFRSAAFRWRQRAHCGLHHQQPDCRHALHRRHLQRGCEQSGVGEHHAVAGGQRGGAHQCGAGGERWCRLGVLHLQLGARLYLPGRLGQRRRSHRQDLRPRRRLGQRHRQRLPRLGADHLQRPEDHRARSSSTPCRTTSPTGWTRPTT